MNSSTEASVRSVGIVALLLLAGVLVVADIIPVSVPSDVVLFSFFD